MRTAIVFATLASSTLAFTPSLQTTRGTTTQLEVTRRDALAGFGGLIAAPVMANAASSTTFFKPEDLFEPAQMSKGDKLDLNSAFVGDYMDFPGMYPTAAGKIASHGPYTTVKDIYKIDGLTANDIAVFKKYDKFFTVNPPGRAFAERINARVST